MTLNEICYINGDAHIICNVNLFGIFHSKIIHKIKRNFLCLNGNPC